MPDPIRFAGLLTDPATAAALPWEPFRPGVEAAWLYRTPDGGPAAALLRYAAGAAVPHHAHVGWEHILVLAGSQQDEGEALSAGDLAINPPGTAHAVASADGCLALLIWERAPRLADEAAAAEADEAATDHPGGT